MNASNFFNWPQNYLIGCNFPYFLFGIRGLQIYKKDSTVQNVVSPNCVSHNLFEGNVWKIEYASQWYYYRNFRSVYTTRKK